MGATDMVSLVLLIMGGLILGLVGACLFDRLASIFHDLAPFLRRIVHVLVGPEAVYATVSVRGIPEQWHE